MLEQLDSLLLLGYANGSIHEDNPYCSNLPEQSARNSCRLDRIEEGKLDGVAGIRMIGSLLGLMGACSIIISTLIKRRVCNPEVHPIFMLSLADCLLSILWIIGSGVWFTDDVHAQRNRTICYLVTVLTGILECVTINLCLLYAVFAYIRIKRTNLTSLLMNQNYHRSNRLFVFVSYLISWFLPCAVLVSMFYIADHYFNLLSSANNCSCWCRPTVINILPSAHLGDNATDKFMHDQLIFMSVLSSTISFQYIIVFIILVLLYLSILHRIRTLKKEIGNREDLMNYGATTMITQGHVQARKRVLLFLTAFVITGFFNLCSELFLLALIQSIFKSDVNHLYLLIYYIFLFAQGFVNAIVYGWSRKDFMNVMGRNGGGSDILGDEDNPIADQEGIQRSFTTTVESISHSSSYDEH